jgi:hypothetical protein
VARIAAKKLIIYMVDPSVPADNKKKKKERKEEQVF